MARAKLPPVAMPMFDMLRVVCADDADLSRARKLAEWYALYRPGNGLNERDRNAYYAWRKAARAADATVRTEWSLVRRALQRACVPLTSSISLKDTDMNAYDFLAGIVSPGVEPDTATSWCCLRVSSAMGLLQFDEDRVDLACRLWYGARLKRGYSPLEIVPELGRLRANLPGFFAAL